MGAASAQVLVQRGHDLLPTGVGLRAQERGGARDDPAQAITALTGVFFDEGGLQPVGQVCMTQSFEGGDGFAPRVPKGQVARSLGHAVDQHRAGAAFTFAATEFGTIQAQLFTQALEHAALFGHAGGVGSSIDFDHDR